MKILAIGNSFSQDATRYLQLMAKSAGEDLYVRNLYIGGCTLERHAHNIKTDDEAYEYQEDARKLKMSTILDGLLAEDWDWVTIQQQSGRSGKYETYEPFLTEIITFIKKQRPNAKIAFHRTWAYEIDFNNTEFDRYERDQRRMYEEIIAATEKAAESHGIPLIKVGNAIQKARGLEPFDYANGGISLCRDGFHLSHEYGRYLAGLVWFNFFTGKSAECVTLTPEGADKVLTELLKACV